MTSQTTKDARTILAANLRFARKAKGWTQRELAAAVGVDTLAVSRWERAAATPNGANLAGLAEVLGRQFAWFYVDHGYDESSPSSGKAAA